MMTMDQLEGSGQHPTESWLLSAKTLNDLERARLQWDGHAGSKTSLMRWNSPEES